MNIPLIAGLALTVFGVYMLGHSVSSYRKAIASQRWPSVDGHMNGVSLWGKRNIGGEMKDAEHVAVEYGYEVGGRKFTGASPAFYTLVYPETVDFAERYPANGRVRVYYNAKDPAESVLIPGPKKNKPYSDLILGFSSVAAGVVIAVLGWMDIIG